MYECVKDVPGRAQAGHTRVEEGSELLRLYPNHFRRVGGDGERILTLGDHSWALQEELDYRRNCLADDAAEDRHQAAEDVRHDRQRRVQSEERFWADAGSFLGRLEDREVTDGLAETWDPESERVAEEARDEERRERYDPDGADFWDESSQLLQRARAEELMPVELRDATESFAANER